MYRHSPTTDFLKMDRVPGTTLDFKGTYKNHGFTVQRYRYKDKAGGMQWNLSAIRKNGARISATSATLKGARALINRWINQFPHEAPSR